MILEACTHNLAYDSQCEETSSDYLFEILTFAQNKKAIETSIVDNLLCTYKDDWDTYLFFDLAGNLTIDADDLSDDIYQELEYYYELRIRENFQKITEYFVELGYQLKVVA